MAASKVLIIMGSDSDLPVMQGASNFLAEMKINHEMHISSAHRAPAKTEELAAKAEENGFSVIIAAAGGAAHLPGVIAAQTSLPVIGVPIKSGALTGVDALYAIVQMPPGIPVATVGIDGAKNAAILAAEILALSDTAIKEKLKAYKKQLVQEVEAKDTKLQKLGAMAYLAEKK